MSLDTSLDLAPAASAPVATPAPLVANPFGTPSLRALVGAPDPLPLPAAGWGAPEALLALDEARLALDLDLAEPQVVSALTTVVLRAGRYAVKVFAPGTDPGHVARVADALAGSRTAVLPVAGPVVTSWGVVSVQPWLVATGTADWAATGRLLRRFHTTHAAADLPTWVPLRRLEPQLAGLPDEAAAVLRGARDVLLDELSVLHLPLGVGAAHGDVSPMNVLRHGRRHLLIDLDFAARGPREYDLSSAARRADSGEIDPGTYLEFCRAYGYDVRAWDGRVVLDRIAALGGVAFRLWDCRRQGLGLDWLEEAVAAWRTPL